MKLKIIFWVLYIKPFCLPMSTEARRESFKRWVRTHPDEWAEINRANARRYYEKHREEVLAKSKERREKRKAQLKKMQEEQGSDAETVVETWGGIAEETVN